MDDIEIVRRALRSSLVSSAPEKLAALDRIEARLKVAEAVERKWADDFARMVTERDKALASVAQMAEQLYEALRSCQELPNSPGPWQAASTALATYDAYAQKGKT